MLSASCQNSMVRSNCASCRGRSLASKWTAEPRPDSQVFVWSTIIAWTSGVREGSRSVTTASTTRSKGTSACANASSTQLGGGRQPHEQGDVLGAADLGEAAEDERIDVVVVGAAGAGAHGRAGPVGGQLQHRRTGQLDPPVLQLLVQRRAGERGTLPHREVRVLHGEFGKGPALVEGVQLPGDHVHGPAVGDDVVHRQHQDVLVGRGAQQRVPHQRARRQIERGLQLGTHDVGDLGVRADGDGHIQRSWLVDELHALTVALLERGAQRLVPGHQGLQRRAQRRHVQLAAQQDGAAGVVLGAVRVDLRGEPHPLLRKRQRQRAGALHRHQSGRAAALHGARQYLGQLRDGRMVEDGAHGHPPAGAPQPGHHLDGEDRVAAAPEEVVAGAHPGRAQHLGEHLGDQFLRLPRRLHEFLALAEEFHFRQCRAVDLSVRVQRKGTHDRAHGRHQIFRKAAGHEFPQFSGIHARAAAGGRDRVSHEVLDPALVRADHHGGTLHLRVRGQHRLDLAQLDTVAAHLHLVVGPPDELQSPAGQSAHHVAGAVHPRPGTVRSARRHGHEPGRGLPGPGAVAVRQPRPRHVQLAFAARRHRPEPGVQHGDASVGQRCAQVHELFVGRRRVQDGAGDGDRRLRRPVDVDEPQAGRGLQYAAAVPRGERVTAGHQRARAAHISSAAASNDQVLSCETTSCAPTAKSGLRATRRKPPWERTTPLGRPVEPEV